MFKRIMKILGFGGYGDSTGAGLSIILTIVVIVPVMVFIGSIVDHLLPGFPTIQEKVGSVAGVFAMLGIIAVVSFVTVNWRHIPLIVLLSLCFVGGIYNFYCMATTKGGKPFPPALIARFQASEEVQQMRAERLARMKYYNRVTGGSSSKIPTGAIVAIVTNPDSAKFRFTVKYKGQDINYRTTSDFELLRFDRTHEVRETGSLLSGPSAGAAAIKDVPKGQVVTLTGESSADASLIEVVCGDDRGWLASDNLFAPVDIKLERDRKFAPKMPSMLLIEITLGIVVLIFLAYWIRALWEYRGDIAAKRGQYPWFNNYVKKCGSPLIGEAMSMFLCAGVSIFAILGIGAASFIVGIIINVLFMLINFYSNLIPSQYDNIVLNIGTPIGPLATAIIGWKIWHNAFEELAGGLTDTCPDCGCPASYMIIKGKNTITGREINTRTVKTTTTKTVSADAYGGGAIGQMFASAESSSSSSTTTYYTPVVQYRYSNDYKCFDCGIEKHVDGKSEWTGEETLMRSVAESAGPEEGLREYSYEKLEEIGRITKEQQAKAKT